MSADSIHAMSETLAADPASLVFIPLAEALLGRGDLVHAARVAQRGMARHPGRVDAHDLVARIALAQGDEGRAEAAWRAVLGIDPSFGTAHRGLGLVRYRQGRLGEALEHLSAAAHEDPADATVRTALDAVRSVIAARGAAVPEPHVPEAHVPEAHLPADVAPTDEHPSAGRALEHADVAGDSAAALFDPILADSKVVALLLDEYGLVAGGQYHTASGSDLGSEIGAHLTGVGEEAERAMRHFGLGQWTRLAIETEAATLAMAPTGTGAVLIAAPRDVPLGYVRRTLERCVAVARLWLGEVA
jgi:predicted regulator of Ras-like GTPase activity (Roadblock/LC7/MglB family)